MRAWSVSVFFPEVKPAHEAVQSCSVEACRMPTAAQRGLDEIFGRDKIKGKRISIAKLTIVEAGKGKGAE